MTYTRESIPDQTGRVAVVTGANGGLGLESAKALAAKGAHVVMAVRDRAKAETAVAEMLRETPAASYELVDLDLASQASVIRAGEDIAGRHKRIDILINNAGLMALPERTTEDGFEMQLGVNHLGHWTFTATLLPSVLASPNGRVVTVTSTAHHMGRPINLENPYMHGSYEPWRAYGNSKLANYHFGLGLQEAFERAGAPAKSLIAHPGLSHSDLQTRTVREGGGGRLGTFFVGVTERRGMDPAEGAMPQLRAATDPAARGGEFYGPRFVNTGRAVRVPVLRPGREKAIRTLWAFSERETGVRLPL